MTAEPRKAVVSGLRYLRPAVPIHFSEGEVTPGGGLHFELRTALYLVVHGELAGRAFVGADQVLWIAQSPAADSG